MARFVLKVFGLCLLLLALALPSLAQNTKGDKPTADRESRFKKTSKKSKPAKRVKSKRRTTSSLRAYKPRKKSKGGENAGRPLSPVYRSRPSETPRNTFPQSGRWVNNRSSSSSSERRSARQASRRRVETRSSSGRVRNVYPQTGRYVNHSSRAPVDPGKGRRVRPRSASRAFVRNRSINTWANFPRPRRRQTDKAYKGDIAGRRIRTKNFETKRPDVIVVPRSNVRRPSERPPRTFQGSGNVRYRAPRSRSGKVYSQDSKYVNNNSRNPNRVTRGVSNRSQLQRLKGLQSRRAPEGGRKVTVVPRSISRPFIRRRSINAWANFPRPKKKGERAVTTDIAGRPLRTKNFRTPPREVIAPRKNRIPAGDRAGFARSRRTLSVTPQSRAWRGDVAKRRVRSGRSSGLAGKPYSGERGGYRSRSGERISNARIPVRKPGVGGWGLERYRGFMKSRKTLGNQGEEFTGNIKSRRRAIGGGSVSGRRWNNQGQPLPSRTPGVGAQGIAKYKGNIRGRRGFSNQGEEFSGNLKSRRPLKGGGSVSGKLWNNNRQPIAARTPGAGSRGIAKYQGNIKGRKVFNNQGEEFSGYIRARRPLKGGGSVSGKLWNNRETPIATRTPTRAAAKAGGYPGNIKLHQLKPGFNNQGEEFTGYIKARKPAKGGGSVSGKLWNNNEQPIIVRAPKSEQGGEFRGKMKQRKYIANKNAAEAALKKVAPTKATMATGGLQVKVEQRPFGKRKGAPDGALPGWKPSKATVKAGEFARGMKAYRYVKNSSSADDALKVREPGKAFVRATDYQGNIKLKKYELFGRRELHPDAKFVRTNKNNVASEKDLFTNFKLWWARLFKKNDNQPGHLKDKGHKPRYDKGEQGLWYD